MYKRFYWVLVAVVIFYIVFMFITPVNPTTLAHYGISALQLRIIGLFLVVPIILIWVAAFYGFIHFEEYAARIRKSPDGIGLKMIADGLLFLSVGFALSGVISTVLQFLVSSHTITQAAMTIVTTHYDLVYPLIGFLLLLIGSERLMGTLKRQQVSIRGDALLAVILLIVGGLYAYLSLQNPSRTTPVGEATSATFYLPDWLIVTTIVVPYVVIWGIGLFSAMRLHTYQQNVPGKIYRQVLRTLELGIIAVIVTSIGIEFLSTATTSLNSLRLGWVIVLLYALLAAIAVGYLLIAYGARNLKKIEDVA